MRETRTKMRETRTILEDRLLKMGVKLDKKHAAIAMRTCYRSASRHPVVVVIILFTIWFYRSFPLLFSLLVYASPVIVSTSALLGTLLRYGHQNAPKVKKEGKPHHPEIDGIKYRVVEDTEFDWKCVRCEARENDYANKTTVVNSVNLNDHHRRVETNSRRSSIDSHVSMADKKLIEEAKSEVCNHTQKTDLGGEKMAFVSHCAQFQPPQGNIPQDHKRWETGSELGENSSRAPSMAGTFPMVDDLQAPHHGHTSNVNSYPASNHSLATNDHDNDNDVEEEENVNDKEDETVSTWTEDDQKSLKNFGKTETERNQHMESLVARQKALRNMRIQAEENLVNINLDISYCSTPHASTRRNSFDQPYDLNETVLDSTPSVMTPNRNSFELPYDRNGEKSYPVGPTFQSDPPSFQPNPQCSHSHTHTHEGFHMGPSSRQNEGFYTFGASENVSQRSRSSDEDDDMAKRRKEKSTAGPTFDSGSSSFQPNDQFSHHHESSDLGPSTLPGYHVSQVSEYVSYSNEPVNLHHVAEGDGRLFEVKTSEGGEQGYQGKISGESSSSSAFSDVTDHLDDEEDEYDFRSAFMPSTPERQIQEQRKNDGHNNIKQSPKSEHDDGRLPPQRPSRVPQWFGWKPSK